jgi:hypothetical protein
LLLDGIDPLEARKAQQNKRALDAAKATTFEQAAQAYFDANESKWRNAKHRQQFLMSRKKNWRKAALAGGLQCSINDEADFVEGDRVASWRNTAERRKPAIG